MSDEADLINHPPHYTSHPSGVECIEIVQHMNFCLGNAIKYIWRAGLKGDEVEDLKKARWYIERELALRTGDDRVETKPPKPCLRDHDWMTVQRQIPSESGTTTVFDIVCSLCGQRQDG